MSEPALVGTGAGLPAVTPTAAPRRAVDVRLVLPATAGWLTAIVLIGVEPPVVSGWAWGVSALSLGVGALLVARRWRAREAVGVVLAVSLAAAAVALAAPARTPAALDAARAGAVTTLQVQLEAAVLPGQQTAVARIVAVTDRDGVRRVVSAPALALGLDVDERVALGSTMSALSRVVPTEPGDARSALVRPLGEWQVTRAPPALLGAADALRASFLDLMTRFGGDGAALLPGLAIGDTSAVGDDLDAAMKRSSLSHLTAVSGANCAIIVGLVLGLGQLARWPRLARVAGALLTLGFFVVLVTPEPSVVRAAVMATAVLLAMQVGRPAQGLPVLALAVMGIVVLDPWIARSYGFVLSVLATAALLLLAGPLTERLSRVMPAPLALGIAVPFAAQLACQPVLILLQPEIPLVGVLANILAAPAAPVATIVGMIACVLAPMLPWLAAAVAAVAWLPSAWIAGIARVMSSLPGAVLPWPDGVVGALVLAAVVIALLLAAGVPWPIASWRVRRIVVAVGLLVGTLGMAVTAGADAVRGLSQPRNWAIAQCDVGQGDAVLMRDAGRVMLIDTGADPALLEQCLARVGVRQIDLLVITHFDLDHVGGVTAVVGRVARVLSGPPGDPTDTAVLDVLAASGADIVPVRQGDTGMLGDARWTSLWPPDHRGVDPGNAASVVLEVRPHADCGGCPSLLALGDVGEAEQRRMLADAGAFDAVDVVKVSHHGSADQHPELYAAAGARIALIGVGADNDYGHPAPAILGVLDELAAAVVRSDRHGLAFVGQRDGATWIWHERGALGE